MPGSVTLSNTRDQLDMLVEALLLEFKQLHLCAPSSAILAARACSTHIHGACGGLQLPVTASCGCSQTATRLAANAPHALRPCLPCGHANILSPAAVQAAVLTHIGVPGCKKENQDTAFCQAHGFGGRPDCSLYGIFDGHGVGGMAISHHCSQLLPYFLSLALEEAHAVGPRTCTWGAALRISAARPPTMALQTPGGHMALLRVCLAAHTPRIASICATSSTAVTQHPPCSSGHQAHDRRQGLAAVQLRAASVSLTVLSLTGGRPGGGGSGGSLPGHRGGGLLRAHLQHLWERHHSHGGPCAGGAQSGAGPSAEPHLNLKAESWDRVARTATPTVPQLGRAQSWGGLQRVVHQV